MVGRKERHPFTEVIPVRADADQIAMDIAHNGQNEPVYLFEKQVVEGRARELACIQLGRQPQYKEWVLLDEGDDVLDWMIRTHVKQHNPTELERYKIVVAALPYYRTRRGSTQARLSKATGISERKVRTLDWLEQAGKTERVLAGEQDVFDAGRALGIVSERRKIALGTGFGKGDKFDEATQPLKRYLEAWKRKDYEFKHLNPKEAERRLQVLDKLAEELRAARVDIEKRSHSATLSAPPERKEKKQE